LRLELHVRFPAARRCRVARHQANDRVRAVRSRHGLAKRTRGQHQSVAITSRGVDDDDFHRPRQRIVLEAVVGDDDVDFRICRQQRARGVCAPPSNPDRESRRGMQQRLVADDAWIVAGSDGARRYVAAAETPADDAGAPPAFA
jgi:hypothetical protein